MKQNTAQAFLMDIIVSAILEALRIYNVGNISMLLDSSIDSILVGSVLAMLIYMLIMRAKRLS